ncbi:MAG: AMP-binding protein, partial [Pseudonocardiaceae bacterium]
MPSPASDPDRVATGANRSPTGRNLAELVAAAARRDPGHPAMVDVTSGRTLSWGALDAAVDAHAGRLREAGVTPGYRVLVRLPTSPKFCVAVFAVLRAGGVLVPFGTGSTARELD